MHGQFFDIRPLYRSFGQTYFNEVSGLCTYFHSFVLEIYRFVQDIYQFVSATDPERVRLEKYKIKDWTHIPYIYTLVVGVAHQDLRREVGRRAAEGGPKIGVSVDAPAEVAQFYDALKYFMRVLSGGGRCLVWGRGGLWRRNAAKLWLSRAGSSVGRTMARAEVMDFFGCTSWDVRLEHTPWRDSSGGDRRRNRILWRY